MDHFAGITNLFQNTLSQMSRPQNQLALKENQIVIGQVLKHFPDKKALIQVGNSKLVAQLETSINAMGKYWFKVKSSETFGLNLKIIKQVEGDKHTQLATSKDLLSLFQQRTSKENIMLANELIKENVPITKNQLMAAIEILKKTTKSDCTQAVEAIISVIKKNYPLTEVVIRSINESQSKVPLAKQIDQLFSTLQLEMNQSPTMKLLSDSLSHLIQKPIEYNVGEMMKVLLSLKTALIAASNEVLSPSLREQIDQLVFRINGQSLLYQDSGPTQQIISQIPLFLNNHLSDLTIQWNGKKQSDGTIDPAFCRILFYLQLPNLKDTMIDVQIQNRVMNIMIRNNSETLGDIVDSYSNALKEIINKMNYRVTSIHVKPFEKITPTKGTSIKQSNLPQTSSYTGVDLKI
jgi:hypothetical protein